MRRVVTDVYVIFSATLFGIWDCKNVLFTAIRISIIIVIILIIIIKVLYCWNSGAVRSLRNLYRKL